MPFRGEGATLRGAGRPQSRGVICAGLWMTPIVSFIKMPVDPQTRVEGSWVNPGWAHGHNPIATQPCCIYCHRPGHALCTFCTHTSTRTPPLLPRVLSLPQPHSVTFWVLCLGRAFSSAC